MSAERIAIVGGGPAGLATARAYRACGGQGAVTLLCEEPLLPYARPPLTKGFLRGEIEERELPIEQRAWFEEHGVELRHRRAPAQRAGCRCRAEQSVAVDEAMRSVSHGGAVLAVGDVAVAHNARAGRALRVEHWGDALTHGEVAGRTLTRGDGRWDSVPGFWSTIGEHTLKHAAWGDGHDRCRLVEHPGGAFSVWYSRGDALVGVLTHDRDEDYERGRELIESGKPAPA
ncbi:MAG TPA: FAD-dependent oxidoreductase [Solirubrobacteraceae bacterium]|nr:FAD-dependent oxidoreductase [Solirubrobacteraceae bacterium]